MYTALVAYIKNIALIMLLTIFAEMVVPDAKIKKYVSVIVGIIMIFTIVGKISDVFVSFSNGDAVLPAFENGQEKMEETEDVRQRLTNILYDEMNEVEETTKINEGLDIHVEKVTPYN